MTHDNLYFFFGDNTLMLHQEVRRWKNEFTKKHGAENFLRLDGARQTLPLLLDVTATMPFLSERRLVICEGLPKMQKEEFAILLDNLHPQTILLIVEEKVDKRLTLYKELKAKAGSVKTFDVLTDMQLRGWINGEVERRKRHISHDAMQALLGTVGNDQYTLLTEIDKLCAYAAEHIAKEDIEALCVPSGTQIVWKLADLLGSRDIASALTYYKQCIEKGEDPYGLWAIVLSMVRNILSVWSAIHDGTNEREIAEATGIHPFSVRGLLPLAKKLTQQQVIHLANCAADADVALKSGGFTYTIDRPQEIIALTERLMLSCL